MTVCGTALLIVTAVVAALRERQPLPEVPGAQTPAEVRVTAVERKPRDAWGLSPVEGRVDRINRIDRI